MFHALDWNVAPLCSSVQNWGMRANVNLDTDAYTFASIYANAKGIPLGAAISELVRRAEQAGGRVPTSLTESRLGLLVRTKQSGNKTVTPEMVKELAEDDL